MNGVAACLNLVFSKSGAVLFLAALHAGCSFRTPNPGTGGKRPYFGHFYCDSNATNQRVTYVAQARFEPGVPGRALRLQGTLLRVLEVRRARPGQRVCFRWPWISDQGRVGVVVGRDTVWREWFNPWP